MYPIRLVAPFAGAWIETPFSVSVVIYAIVAPFAGAWIETIIDAEQRLLCRVAPFAGAWIETYQILKMDYW